MRRIAVAAWAATLLALGSFAAGENVFYADATFGSDDWDGTEPQHVPDTDHGPKKSLQAAVNLVPKNSAPVAYTIYAATGVYDRVEGAVGGSCSNRVFIGDSKRIGVIATGRREDTVIKGAPDGRYANGFGSAAVRCVYIAGNSSGSYVRGFTLSGGYTSSGNNGVGACVSSTTAGAAAAVDCVLTNSYVAYRGMANNATLIRCSVFSPVIGNYGMFNSQAFNCLIYSSGFGTHPYVNCSFISGGAQGSSDTARAKFYNCYFNGSTQQYGNYYRCFYTGGLNTKSTDYYDCMRIAAPVLDAATYRPEIDSVLVDAGSNTYYTAQMESLPADIQALLDEDFAGGQRVYNGRVDIGAGEFDWRGGFAERLKHDAKYNLVVAGASPDVVTNAVAGVTVSDGDTVSLDWTFDRDGEISFSAVQSGEGSLSVTCDGSPVAVNPETGRGSAVVSAGAHRLEFSFSGSGSVAISDICEPRLGMFLIFR